MAKFGTFNLTIFEERNKKKKARRKCFVMFDYNLLNNGFLHFV